MRGRRSGERGAALLVVLMATTLLMALGAGLAMLTATEARLAAHFGAGLEALYAADAALERTVADLASTPDWASVAAGSTRSTFVDGAPSGLRSLADGTQLDLDTIEPGAPWRLYAHAPIRQLMPQGFIDSSVYVTVWVAPAGDGTGSDLLMLRARAYGAYGTRRVVEAYVARGGVRPRVVGWREL